ncbi:MAG: SDR family oxidoreductase [Flavobacteriaceae bacterium]|nr:SDR family oxidoreductase [Flavobacteriaceae bacterium]
MILKNKVAIITGASSGIGKATAELFVKEGAMLVLSDINEKDGKALQEKLNKVEKKVVFLKADVGQEEDHIKLVNLALSEFGKLDIAVNNAGIGGPQAKTGNYPTDGWLNVININLNGVFYGMKHQIQAMQKNGKGSIVNISSILGSVGTQQSPAYVTAKHGMNGLTKAAALEHAEDLIRVNSVGPGYIKTPLLDNNLDEATLEMLKKMHALQRLGKSEEVAELILWLASDKASFVTGSYHPVDGGYLAQ